VSDGIRIEVDRADRVYRTGEQIAGEVIVEVADGSRCKAVILRRRWRTHGRGTVHRAELDEVVLHQGPLPDDGEHRFPFELDAPLEPFTYRGHYLNIDHYLEGRVDIPWAFDPDVEEEYVVVPGSTVASAPLTEVEAASPRAVKKMEGRTSTIIGAVLAAIGLFTFPFPGLFFLFIAAFFLMGGLWKKAAGMKVGQVDVEVSPRRVAPGEQIRVAVRITPPKEVTVNGVTASLLGKEICVSGSGTDKTTHRHTGHSETVELVGETTFPAGTPQDLEGTLEVPALGMWTFRAPRNEIRWDVEVRVDVPSWPDWSDAMEVVVWPGEEAGEAPAEPATVAAAPVASSPRLTASRPPGEPWTAGPPSEEGPAPTPHRSVQEAEVGATDEGTTRVEASGETTRLEAEPPEPPHAEVPEPSPASGTGAPHEAPTPPGAAPAAAGEPVADLGRTVEELLELDLFGGGRDEAVAELVGRPVDFVLVVERVERTMGRSRDPAYEEGHTLRGTASGSEAEVEVRVAEADAARVKDLRRGDEHRVEGTVVSWERLLERPVIRARPGGADGAGTGNG
jgi:hypothetical protein